MSDSLDFGSEKQWKEDNPNFEQGKPRPPLNVPFDPENERRYAETQDELESVPPDGPAREAFDKQVAAAAKPYQRRVKEADEGTRRFVEALKATDSLQADYRPAELAGLATRPVPVLQDWVLHCTLAEQGTLMTSVRGPDNVRKGHPVKEFIRCYRRAVLNGAFPTPNDFMAGEARLRAWEVARLCGNADASAVLYPDDTLGGQLLKFWESQVDDCPHHWLLHLSHTAEIVGYRHPASEVAEFWLQVYLAICKSFHMNPESAAEMSHRLRDRGYY